MKFTLSWLKDHLETDEPLEKLAARLTMIGLEVEHIDDKADGQRGDTLRAHELLQGQALPVRQAAWYTKPLPTFVDALALVRRALWAVPVFSLSPQATDMIEIPRSRWDRLTTALAYAA